jgi:hypothetical protein
MSTGKNMVLDQLENPLNHADTAPAGEIRDEPRSVLKRFTLIVVISLLLPLTVFVVEGLYYNRTELAEVGIIVVVVFGILSAAVLWKIIASRGISHR